MKAAGILFILLSAASVGLRISAALKKRCKDVSRFLSSLSVLEYEISFLRTPLPQAFEKASQIAVGDLQSVYRSVSQQMKNSRWLSPRSAVENSLNEFPNELFGEILLELSDMIGKYDLQAQLNGIETAKLQTSELLSGLEQERSLRSKTYKTLSICAGLALVILLL